MRTLEPILAEHPFFCRLDKRHLEVLTGCASNVVFQEGYIIISAREKRQIHLPHPRR
jgi:CRP/FNR family cyclic AMP-dependent transcriptional regulator